MIGLTRNPRTASTMNAKTTTTSKKSLKILRGRRSFAIFVMVSGGSESGPV
jgi:hypothetical protein